MLRFLTAFALCLIVLTPAQVRAQDGRVRLYAFGNSLVNHLSDDPDTNVPVWVARLARADGRRFSMDGQWGFLRDFSRDLPPSANWSFRGVRGAWNPGRRTFGKAGFSHILITPANFTQYQPADAPYEDDPNTSPLTATLALIDWLAAESPDSKIALYEGWADMAGFEDKVAKYNAFNAGTYHDWYTDLQAQISAARPGIDLTLIPVARVLAQAFTDSALSEIPAQALYTDNAPHGTATLYLLAAMVSYASLFDAPPPAGFTPPEGIHPTLRDNFADVAHFIWAQVNSPEKSAEIALPQTQSPAEIAPEATTDDTTLITDRNLIPVLMARPDTGLSDPALAMGLNGLADWSVQHPFVDIFKTARTWVGHTDGQWGAFTTADLQAGGHLDANGWPTSLPEGATSLEALILTDQPTESPALAHRYRVTYEGEGSLRLVGRASKVSVRDGEIWFSYSPGEGAVGLAISSTDPAGNGNNIRNITVIRADHVPLQEVGVLFNPDWLEVVDNLRVLRFMDWMMTNGSPVTDWASRPVEADYTYTRRGVPVEVMVQLANQIGADPWFTMPHMADDDFVRRFAEYTRDHLDPRLIAYTEYSNEVWNFIFPQSAWAQEQAAARWGGAADIDGWMQFAGMRASQMASLWSTAYGDAADARLKRVIAVHTGWLGLEEPLLDAPLWRAENPDAPSTAEAFDAYAVSGYFGHELGSDEMAETVRGWMRLYPENAHQQAANALRSGSLNELLTVLYPHHAKIAATNGLELIMYEGGTHVAGLGAQVNDEDMTYFFNVFNYSYEMATLYQDLLSGWRAAGGTLFNAFVDVAQPSQYGSWGALRHLGDSNPRADALWAYNSAPAGWETRANGTFLHGITTLGDDGANVLMGSVEEDILLAGDGDDLLVSNGGGDYLHGGDGLDVAVLSHSQDAYIFTKSAGRIIADGPAGRVTLFAVEYLQFTDQPGEILELSTLP